MVKIWIYQEWVVQHAQPWALVCAATVVSWTYNDANGVFAVCSSQRPVFAWFVSCYPMEKGSTHTDVWIYLESNNPWCVGPRCLANRRGYIRALLYNASDSVYIYSWLRLYSYCIDVASMCCTRDQLVNCPLQWLSRFIAIVHCWT